MEKRRTNDEPLLLQALVYRVLFGNDKHALYAGTRPLLTKHHLQDRGVNGLPRNLATELVELSVRDFEIRGGIFVL